MTQLSIFGPGDSGPAAKPTGDSAVEMRVLVTVKAAPNPSEKYGETVCVAGVRMDWAERGWVRLYPINFRHLDSDDKFRKYDVITIRAKPARQDQRRESWNPLMDSVQPVDYLEPWRRRREWLDPYVEDSMCRLNRDARQRPDAQSLALVRVTDVSRLQLVAHPGWSKDEQAKIDAYVNQLDLFVGQRRTPLEAPRMRAFYHYRCADRGCRGHRQGLLDWELVAFQRRHSGSSDAALADAIQAKFLHELCGPARDVAFYVGNQAKRAHVFSVLGVYWPPRR